MLMPKDKIRTVTFLSREQVDYLDKLGKDALFSDGIKLSRAHILSEMVNLLMHLKINVKKMDLMKNKLEDEILKILNTENGKNNHGEDLKIVPHLKINFAEAKDEETSAR